MRRLEARVSTSLPDLHSTVGASWASELEACRKRRRRGERSLTASERACLGRFVGPPPDFDPRAVSFDASGSHSSPSRRPKLVKRASEAQLAPIKDLEVKATADEEHVARILRSMYPSNARSGSAWRKHRGSFDKAVTMHLPEYDRRSTPLPVPSTASGTKPPTARTPMGQTRFETFSKAATTALDRITAIAPPRSQTPGHVMDTAHFAKMTNLLRREIQLQVQDSSATSAFASPVKPNLSAAPAFSSPPQRSFRQSLVYTPSLENESMMKLIQAASNGFSTPSARQRSAANSPSKLKPSPSQAFQDLSSEKEAQQRRRSPVRSLKQEDNVSFRSFRNRILEMYPSLGHAFVVFDVDRDQELSQGEFISFFRDNKIGSIREARGIFELLDANHDKAVSLHEFHIGMEAVAQITGFDGVRKRLICLGFKTILQAIRAMEGGQLDARSPLSFEDLSTALSRVFIVEPDEHRMIYENVKDRGDMTSRPSLNDLAAAIAPVSPNLLLEEVAARANLVWDSPGKIWSALGPAWGEDATSVCDFKQKLIEMMGISESAADKASRLIETSSSGLISRHDLLSALNMAKPSYELEDLRKKVSQRYRSIETAFRESFPHREHDQLNNDPDLRLTCSEFASILESVDLNRHDIEQLFSLADACDVGKLTLYEFFRCIKLFTPGRVIESFRLQALLNTRRVSDCFRNCGVAWNARLNLKAFSDLMEKLGFSCDVQAAFDFLDVRTSGSVCITEIIAALQSLTPSSREHQAGVDRERKVEKAVRAELATLRKTVSDFKVTVRQSWDEGEVLPASISIEDTAQEDTGLNKKSKTVMGPSISAAMQAQGKLKGSFDRVARERELAMARKTFQRIDLQMNQVKEISEEASASVKLAVDSLCGYFASTETVLREHLPLLSATHSRSDRLKKT